MSKRIRVVVLFGGRSGEHEVSLASARSVMGALDPDKYEVVPVGISREGRWLFDGDPMTQLVTAAEQRHQLTPGSGEQGGAVEVVQGGGIAVSERPTGPAPLATADVVFPVLHGPYGEDGSIQGLLEVAGLPYVGSGVAGSAVGMDKILMKGLFAAAGLRQLPYLALSRHEWEQEPEGTMDRIEATLPYPLFTKPANLGSSVGISKVRNRSELRAALELAARYDRRIVVEQGLERPREIEVAVLGNEEPIASIAGEVVPETRHEFYSYDSKYRAGEARLLIPAPVSEELLQQLQQMAILAYKAIDAAGLSRVDFLVERESGDCYLNEVNTMPGFTPLSMYAMLWEASGLSYSILLERLIELALERHRERQRNEI